LTQAINSTNDTAPTRISSSVHRPGTVLLQADRAREPAAVRRNYAFGRECAGSAGSESRAAMLQWRARAESARLSPRPDRFVARRPIDRLASKRTARHVGAQLFGDRLLTIRATLQGFAYSNRRLRLRAAATAAFPNGFPDAANAAFMPQRTLGVCIRAKTASNSRIWLRARSTEG
jgi:hypothetical protein